MVMTSVPARAMAVLAISGCATTVYLLAHGGHGGVQPIARELRAGDQTWRASVGVLPQDPVAGEEVRIEVKAEALGGAKVERVATPQEVRARVDGTPVDLRAANTSGVLGGHYQATVAGQHVIVVEVRTTSGVGRQEYPLQIRTGPAARLRPLVAGTLALLAAAFVFVLWQRRQQAARGGSAATWLAGAAVGAVAIVALGTMTIVPLLARQFLPEREPAAIDWETDTPEQGTGDKASRLVTPGSPATPATPDTPDEVGATISGRVVSAPGAVADVVVPMPGRVVAVDTEPVTIGRKVSAGQTLVMLQPTYNLHDAVHLIQQRWPILQSQIDANRRMLETQATSDRLKRVFEQQAASLAEVQAAEAAAAVAKQEYEKWDRTLAMHDEQIRDDQPARTLIRAPIGGEIAAARFTQGQIVYEGDPLFTIVDLNTVWVEVKVPERFASRFRDEDVELVAPAFPDLRWQGRLQRIAAQVDPETGTLSRFYAVENHRKLLRIGMIVGVRWSGRPKAATS